MKSWEDSLPPTHFVRVHRSAIINLARYRGSDRESFETTLLHLLGQTQPVRASFRYLEELRTRLARSRVHPSGPRRHDCGGVHRNCLGERSFCWGIRRVCLDNRRDCLGARYNCWGARRDCLDNRWVCWGELSHCCARRWGSFRVRRRCWRVRGDCWDAIVCATGAFAGQPGAPVSPCAAIVWSAGRIARRDERVAAGLGARAPTAGVDAG
eukprot:gene13965-18488_t